MFCRKTIRHTYVVIIPGGITIMPTIIIIHSSKYRVLFSFISSRCMGRYSDVQYFPIPIPFFSKCAFMSVLIGCESDYELLFSWRQTYFPSYPCPFECTNYCSFQIYSSVTEYHPIPAYELIALGGGGIIIFNIFSWPNVWCFLHWYHTSSTIEDS